MAPLRRVFGDPFLCEIDSLFQCEYDSQFDSLFHCEFDFLILSVLDFLFQCEFDSLSLSAFGSPLLSAFVSPFPLFPAPSSPSPHTRTPRRRVCARGTPILDPRHQPYGRRSRRTLLREAAPVLPVVAQRALGAVRTGRQQRRAPRRRLHSQHQRARAAHQVEAPARARFGDQQNAVRAKQLCARGRREREYPRRRRWRRCALCSTAARSESGPDR